MEHKVGLVWGGDCSFSYNVLITVKSHTGLTDCYMTLSAHVTCGESLNIKIYVILTIILGILI